MAGTARPEPARRGGLAAHPAVVEALLLVGFLALILIAFGYRLGSVIVSDMDEGTYLLAGTLVAHGQLPYRDFMLTHPPAIAYLSALWLTVAGPGVMPARIAYSVLVLASTVPLYLLTRAVTHSRAAGLLAVGSYATGMLLLANMGRTVRLEPVMNAALIAGAWLYLSSKAPGRWVILSGALLGAAGLVKVVAVIPIACLLLADLCWRRDLLVRRWGRLAIGAAAVLLPAAIGLVAQPRFLEDVFFVQLERPDLPLGVRVGYLVQDLLRDPLIALGLVASAWFVVRASDVRLRAISLVGLLSTAALVLAFRTFFGYYLVQALPWISVAAAAAVAELARALAPAIPRRWSTRAIVVAALLLATAVPVAYGEVYARTAHDHVSSAAQIVDALRATEGPVYSMYPSFALWTKREACGSYYVADSLIGRITGRLRDDDFVALFSSCPSLVLWTGELGEYPKAAGYVSQHFALVVENQDYALWTRKPSP